MKINAYDLINDVCKLDSLNKQKVIPAATIEKKRKEIFPDDFLDKISNNLKNSISELNIE